MQKCQIHSEKNKQSKRFQITSFKKTLYCACMRLNLTSLNLGRISKYVLVKKSNQALFGDVWGGFFNSIAWLRASIMRSCLYSSSVNRSSTFDFKLRIMNDFSINIILYWKYIFDNIWQSSLTFSNGVFSKVHQMYYTNVSRSSWLLKGPGTKGTKLSCSRGDELMTSNSFCILYRNSSKNHFNKKILAKILLIKIYIYIYLNYI